MKRMTLAVLTAVVLMMLGSCAEKTTGPEFYGVLFCQSTPSDASFWLNDRYQGKTPKVVAGIKVGNYRLKISQYTYDDWVENITIAADETLFVNANLSQGFGTLNVRSEPAGAEIWMVKSLSWNSRNTGYVTPHTFTDVEPGHYQVRLLMPNHFPSETSFWLHRDSTETINATLNPCPAYTVAYTLQDSIFVVKLDGLNPVKVADDFLQQHYEGVYGTILWSPDGRYLTYSGQQGAVLYDRDTNIRINFPFRSDGRYNDFNWSHDSDQYCFGVYFDAIYANRLSTGDFRKIHDCGGRVYCHNPVYSPGDSLIAYALHSWGSDVELCLMRADGSQSHAVSRTIAGTEYDESLDLAWISDHELLFKIEPQGIYRLDIESQRDSLLIPSSYVFQLRLSPDNRSYAYLDYQGEVCKIFWGTVGNWSPLVLAEKLNGNNIYWDDQLAWSPDNQGLAVAGAGGIYWVLLDGTIYRVIDRLGSVIGISVRP